MATQGFFFSFTPLQSGISLPSTSSRALNSSHLDYPSTTKDIILMGSAPSSPRPSRSPSPVYFPRSRTSTLVLETPSRGFSANESATRVSPRRMSDSSSVSSEASSSISSDSSPGTIAHLPSPRSTSTRTRGRSTLSPSAFSSPRLLQRTTSPSPRSHVCSSLIRKPNRPALNFLSPSRFHTPNIPTPRSLSPLSRMKRSIAIEAEERERRNKPSRSHRRLAIIGSPEPSPTGCHCLLGHKDFKACSADPQSPYFSSESVKKEGDLKMGRKKETESRPAKKRKAAEAEPEEVKFECECGGGHATELECEYAVALEKHVDITTSVIIGSQAMVTIVAGSEQKQLFLVHKELLALHSGYFQDLFSGRSAKKIIREELKAVAVAEPKQRIKQEVQDDNVHSAVENNTSGSTNTRSVHRDPLEDMFWRLHDMKKDLLISPSPEPTISDTSTNQEIGTLIPRPRRPSPASSPAIYSLPTINPSQFAQFVSFLYAGRIINAFDPLTMTIEHNSIEALWYMGRTLRSASFQNDILEGLRTSEAVKSGTWPSPEDIEIVYDLDQQHSFGGNNDEENRLKKFGTHCLGANNPFERYEESSVQGKAWLELSKKRNDVFMDAFKASGSRWALTKPWDDKMRGDYMVEEEEIEVRWQKMIVARRGRDGVKAAAQTGDVGARLEEIHLVAEETRLGYRAYDSESAEEDDAP